MIMINNDWCIYIYIIKWSFSTILNQSLDFCDPSPFLQSQRSPSLAHLQHTGWCLKLQHIFALESEAWRTTQIECDFIGIQGDGGGSSDSRSNKFNFLVFDSYLYGYVSKPCTPVNIKIAGKWMFIPLKMVLIGIDPYLYDPYLRLRKGYQSLRPSGPPMERSVLGSSIIPLCTQRGPLLLSNPPILDGSAHILVASHLPRWKLHIIWL